MTDETNDPNSSDSDQEFHAITAESPGHNDDPLADQDEISPQSVEILDEGLLEANAGTEQRDGEREHTVALASPISCLPIEVLFRVFEFAQESCEAEHSVPSRNSLNNICAVSSLWRALGMLAIGRKKQEDQERDRVIRITPKAPISRAPPEVLLRVFEIAEESCHAEPWASSRNLLISICAVSSRWRTLAIGMSRLWTWCALPHHGWEDMLRLWLTRSGNRGIVLFYSRLLVQGTLHVGFAPSGLEQVKLAPLRISSLRMRETVLSWPCSIITSITSIFLEAVMVRDKEFWTMLDSCPLLEYLSILRPYPEQSLGEGARHIRISLPKLTYIECTASQLVVIGQHCHDMRIQDLVILVDSGFGEPVDLWFAGNAGSQGGVLQTVTSLTIRNADDPFWVLLIVQSLSSITSLTFQHCLNPLVLDAALGNDRSYRMRSITAGLPDLEWAGPALTFVTIDNTAQFTGDNLHEILAARQQASERGAVLPIDTVRVVDCNDFGDATNFTPEWTRMGIKVLLDASG